jgi:hypothetical protein
VRNEPKIPPPPHLIVFFFGSADRFFSILFNVPFTLHGQNYTESPGWVKMSRDRGLATSKATTLFVLFCFLMGKKRIHLGFFTQRMMRVWNVRDCFLEFQLFALFHFCFTILSADGPWQIDHVVEQPVIFFSECYYPDNEADMSGGAFF